MANKSKDKKRRKGRRKVNTVGLLNKLAGPLTDDRMELLLWQQYQSKKRGSSTEPETMESFDYVHHRPISAESKALSDAFDSKITCSLPAPLFTLPSQVEETSNAKKTFSKISVCASSSSSFSLSSLDLSLSLSLLSSFLAKSKENARLRSPRHRPSGECGAGFLSLHLTFHTECKASCDSPHSKKDPPDKCCL
jgi:hypothetical protein